MVTRSSFKIITADPEWADRYRLFCQPHYQRTYARPELGLTVDLWSPEIFEHDQVKQYFATMFSDDPDRRAWLALDEQQQIIGGIAAHRDDAVCEPYGFYVTPEHRGQGIGKALFRKVEEFAGNRSMELDVLHYLDDAISMYERWGFRRDDSKGRRQYTWPDWPESAHRQYWGIYFTRPFRRR